MTGRRRQVMWAIAAVGALFALALAAGIAVDQGVIHLQDPELAEFPVRGIDVSHHQGAIDWPAVAASGQAAFAWIKATEGGDWVDPRFAENWDGARAAGVRAGAYHYFTLCTAGNIQAAHFLRTVPAGGALPPALDLEHVGNCTHAPAPDAVRAEVHAFLDAVTSATRIRPVLYTTRNFWRTILGDGFSDYPLWLRDVFRRPVGLGAWRWDLWQFLSRGRVTGIEGFVDQNVFRGNEASFSAFLAGSAP